MLDEHWRNHTQDGESRSLRIKNLIEKARIEEDIKFRSYASLHEQLADAILNLKVITKTLMRDHDIDAPTEISHLMKLKTNPPFPQEKIVDGTRRFVSLTEKIEDLAVQDWNKCLFVRASNCITP